MCISDLMARSHCYNPELTTVVSGTRSTQDFTLQHPVMEGAWFIGSSSSVEIYKQLMADGE